MVVAVGTTGMGVDVGAAAVGAVVCPAEVGAVVAVAATLLVGLPRAMAVCVLARMLPIALLGSGVGKGMLLLVVGVAIGAFEADFWQADNEVTRITTVKRVIHKRFFIRRFSFLSKLHVKKSHNGYLAITRFFT